MERYKYWTKTQKDSNAYQKVQINDKPKHETVPYIPSLIQKVEASNLKDKDILLVLNGACIRSDVGRLRCDGETSKNYVDFENKKFVYQYVTKKDKLEEPIIIDDLDNRVRGY